MLDGSLAPAGARSRPGRVQLKAYHRACHRRFFATLAAGGGETCSPLCHPLRPLVLGPDIVIHAGGQTGVDRAALDAAMVCGVPVGGWCPRGRRAEDGPIPARYPLAETASSDYAERTRRNVLDADATLVLTWGR